MKLLTTLAATALLALGACSSAEQRGEPSRGVTCLPPSCIDSTTRPPTRSATSAKPTVKPRAPRP